MLVSGHKLLPVAVVLGLILLFLVFATKPLARFIAKIGYSIRLKMEIAIAAVAVLFLLVSLIGFGAMEYMHDGLHDIQDLMESDHRNIGSVKVAIGELEDSRHGFPLLPDPLSRSDRSVSWPQLWAPRWPGR